MDAKKEVMGNVLLCLQIPLTEDGLQIISIGTFHNWLKEHCKYIGIRMPSMSDYCDTCKELRKKNKICQ